MKSGPRIVAGSLRGRILVAPEGLATRPTSARVRQAWFDILAHALWAERAIVGRTVLDGFAGSGALGLEALSRGAARATFIEADRSACAAIRLNIEACRVGDRADLVVADALAPPRAAMPHDLVLLDPPYGAGLVSRALDALGKAGWIAPGALIAAEFGRADPIPDDIAVLAERAHGPARLAIWRAR